MATTPKKRGDKWFIQIRRNGKSKSATFTTEQQAIRWARAQEVELDNQRAGIIGDQPYVGDVLRAFRDKRAPLIKGYKGAINTMNRLLDANPGWDKVRSDRFHETLKAWVRVRLTQIKPASVKRELSFLSQAYKWAMDHNVGMVTMTQTPLAMIGTWPGDSKARDRTVTHDEMVKIVGEPPRGPTPSISSYIPYVVWFAYYTGMRMGEICQLTWSDIDVKAETIHVRDDWREGRGTKSVKNGFEREVPMTEECLELILALSDHNEKAEMSDKVFGVEKGTLDVLWRRALTDAGFETGDIHFHDLRHTALTNFAQWVEVLDLAKISGHRKLDILLNTYYKTTGQKLAERIRIKKAVKAAEAATAHQHLQLVHNQRNAA